MNPEMLTDVLTDVVDAALRLTDFSEYGRVGHTMDVTINDETYIVEVKVRRA